MSKLTLHPFESWDLSAPVFPPRSRLYSLEPIGVGTAYVESLTGYVSRLAAAHSVSVGDLVGRELAENSTGRLSLVGPGKRLASYLLNGTAKSTRLWIKALEAKTCRTELRLLTLLPFEEILPATRLFRKRRAWCADCFRLWCSAERPLYEPLLWSLAAAAVCPLHKLPLQQRCPWCNHDNPALAVFTRPGHCARCQRWLGIRAHKADSRASDAGGQAVWAATALGSLLNAEPQLPIGRMRAAFRDNLRWLIGRFAGGNITAFAQGAAVRFWVLDAWLKDGHIPNLDSFLQLSEKLNIWPIHLISPGGAKRVDMERIEEMMRNGPGYRKRFPNAAEVRRELRCAANQIPPVPLTHVAQKLGFANKMSLYKVDGALCRRITENYWKYPGSYWWRQKGAKPICSVEVMKEALEDALAADDPPSIKRLCKRLGYADVRSMWNRFPQLCRALTAKRRTWKAGLPARILPLIEKALLEEPPPTLQQIATRVGMGHRDTLKRYCPGLPRQLAERQRAFRRARDAHRKAALEQALAEDPAPSLVEVAKRLRLSAHTFEGQFRDLSAAVRVRYRTRASTSGVAG